MAHPLVRRASLVYQVLHLKDLDPSLFRTTGDDFEADYRTSRRRQSGSQPRVNEESPNLLASGFADRKHSRQRCSVSPTG